MPHVHVSFPGRSDAFSVRTFRVTEALSTPFEIALTALSEHEDADLDALVGSDAVFSLASPTADDGEGTLTWTGVCAHAEILRAEPSGLSTYSLTIVPELWLLTQRTNCRVFRRKTAVEIAVALLREWGIAPELRLLDEHPTLDFRIQYNESDFAFLSRTLEEAGVTYSFRVAGGRTALVLADRPADAPLHGEPIPFHADASTSSTRRWVTDVHRSARVRPGAYKVRDHDLHRPGFPLQGDAVRPEHARLERYEYLPGAAVAVPRGPRAGEGAADGDVLRAVAQRRLEAARVERRGLGFATSALELAPGTITAIAGHPRSDVTSGTRLLVTSTRLEGEEGREYRMRVEAVFASEPFRPPRRTPKPWIGGVQSATVVGLPGQEIHVDDLGRVRVLFPWDQEGARGDGTSCWVRVSHGWAGSAFGIIANPRVGEEVLVAFLDGDPDAPVVVGRLHNATHVPPFPLPANKTKSGIVTHSSRGGGGQNELSFEDRTGHERVYLHAQKDHEIVVRNNQTTRVGANRTDQVSGNRYSLVIGNELASVGGNLVQSVTQDESRTVEGNRSSTVAGNAIDVVRGRSDVRVEEDASTYVGGRERREVRREADLIHLDDLTFRVGGSATTMVGTHDHPRSYTLHVEGVTTLSGTDATEIRSETGLVLRCGDSAIHVLPDRIELVSPTIVQRAEGASQVLGEDQVKTKVKKKIALVSEEKIILKAKEASVSLASEAKIDGSKVKLKSPDAESVTLEDEEGEVTVIELVDAEGRPLAGRRYRLVLEDGSERSGVLDADGRAQERFSGSAEITFPELAGAEAM